MSGVSISRQGEDFQCDSCECHINDPSYTYCPWCGEEIIEVYEEDSSETGDEEE